jgi:hypothetical protein
VAQARRVVTRSTQLHWQRGGIFWLAGWTSGRDGSRFAQRSACVATTRCGRSGWIPKSENTPQNHGRYNVAMSAALNAAGLQNVYRENRKTAIQCGGYLNKIAAWREDLRRSPDRSDRHLYFVLNHPQKVWAEFSKLVLGHHAAPKEPLFANLSIRKALALPDCEVAAGFAVNLSAPRLYAVADAMLERLPTPMRPVPADSVVLHPDATWRDILAAVDEVGLSDADRAKLAGALTSAAEDVKRRTPALEIKDLVVRQGGANQRDAADHPHQPEPR